MGSPIGSLLPPLKNSAVFEKYRGLDDFLIYFTFIIVTLSERRVYFYCIASLELAAIQCIYYPTYVKERVSWVVKTWGAEASRTKVLGSAEGWASNKEPIWWGVDRPSAHANTLV